MRGPSGVAQQPVLHGDAHELRWRAGIELPADDRLIVGDGLVVGAQELGDGTHRMPTRISTCVAYACFAT